MAVIKIKDYVIENGKNVPKDKELYNKQTKNGTALWFFVTRHEDLSGKVVQKRSKQFSTKKAAEEAERNFLISLSDEKVKETVLFSDIANLYFSSLKHVKESTIYTHQKEYNKHIKPYFRKRKIDEIAVKDISLWHNKLTGYHINYQNKLHGLLKLILDHAIKLEYVDRNVAQVHGGFKSPNDDVIDDAQRIRYITPTQYELIFTSIEDDIKYKAFFALSYWLGARIGELQALSWNDMNLETWFVRINKTLSNKTISGGVKITNTKNRKNRTIIIPVQARELILGLYEREKQLDGFT